MSEYQAIYDAVRSRIHGGNVDEIVRDAVRGWDFSHLAQMIQAQVSEALGEATAPHVLMRPRIFPDGNQWCALYGENLQDGVCGFGDTPGKAARAFDRNWHNEQATKPKTEGGYFLKEMHCARDE